MKAPLVRAQWRRPICAVLPVALPPPMIIWRSLPSRRVAIGNIPPAEAEANYSAALETEALAA